MKLFLLFLFFFFYFILFRNLYFNLLLFILNLLANHFLIQSIIAFFIFYWGFFGFFLRLFYWCLIFRFKYFFIVKSRLVPFLSASLTFDLWIFSCLRLSLNPKRSCFFVKGRCWGDFLVRCRKHLKRIRCFIDFGFLLRFSVLRWRVIFYFSLNILGRD